MAVEDRRWYCVDVYGQIIGTTRTKDTEGLFSASTAEGKEVGLVELKSYDWPRSKKRFVMDLYRPLVVKRVT